MYSYHTLCLYLSFCQQKFIIIIIFAFLQISLAQLICNLA